MVGTGPEWVLRDNAMYNQGMAKEVIHISEAEAANDFASLLDRVRKGAEIVIETDERPVAVLRAAGHRQRH